MITSIIEAFSGLPDPRREHPQKLHKLIDIVVIGLCAVLAKCDTWEEIADYGEAKRDFFKSFLELPNEISSHDPFNRVFSLLSPTAWQSCLMTWITSVRDVSSEKLISVDGKVLRASKASGTGKQENKQTALALVSAWASENELVLAQLALDAKDPELTVIPNLLGLLDLEGASVSLDAAGCHPRVTEQITAQGGNYVLALKAIIVIESHTLRKDQPQTSRRFFLTSPTYTADGALQRVRKHWSVENQQHYPLDVLFAEDASRTRKGFAAQNLAALRRLALNLDTSTSFSKRRKRLRALLDDRYLICSRFLVSLLHLSAFALLQP